MSRLWNVAYVVAGAAIATAVAWPIYQTPRLAVITVVAAAAGVAIVLLARRMWVIAALTAAAYLLLVVPLAVPSGLASPERALLALRDGVAGLILGWKQLLTLTLPLGEYQAVLVPFLAVILGGTVLALTLIVRGRRAAPLAAAVVIAMSAFGMVFGSSDTGAALAVGALVLPAPREILLGLAALILSLAWLLGRARIARVQALRLAQASTDGVRQARQSAWRQGRRRILAAVLVVTALVGGLALAPVAAAISPRQALRDRVDPLVVLRQQPSPLSAYRSWFADPVYDAELFTVTGDTDRFDRLRIATLDSYDGHVFEVAANSSFTRLPSTSPASGSSEITVTIGDGFSGPWVPVPSGLSAAPRFEGARADALADGFYVGESDATGIDTAAGGLGRGDSYRVSGVAAGTDSMDGARGAESRIPADAYPALARWVELQDVPRTGAGLRELIDRLTERGYLSHSLTEGTSARSWIADLSTRAPYGFTPSYSGHSTARIEELFADLVEQQVRAGESRDDALLVSAVGDDEQFATAAALLARYLGFDSRVVVGVRLSAAESSSVEPCAHGVCTGSNVTAWVEVLAPGGEWVAFDSSPQFAVAPTTIAVGEQLPENPTVPDQAPPEVVDPPAAQRDDSTGADAPVAAAPGWLEALLPVLARVGMGSLLVLLLVLPAVVLAVAKATRRAARRRAEIAEVSIVGAWDELVDTYLDNGVTVAPHLTRSAAAREIGRTAAVALAAAADTAVFDETPPDSAASARAWSLVDDERAVIRRASTRMERLRSAITPASFLRALRRTDTA